MKVFRLDLPPERVHQLAAELDRLTGAALSHPSIVRPLACGIDGATAYLAYEYVAAESLDVVVRQHGAAPAADALRLAAQLAGALDFAAVVGIEHGALHPRDVLVSSEEIRLTGLGVARALERTGVEPPVRRPYTAPERIAGAAWDRRADVFSLAAIVHELLWARRITAAGAHAADGATPLAGADAEALAGAFARALAEDPAERFATALEFVEALRLAFPDLVIPPVPPAHRPGAARTRASRPAAAMPALPLEEPESANVVEVDAAVDRGAAAAPDLDLRTAAAGRYEQVEVAPAIEEPAITEPAIPVTAADVRIAPALGLDAPRRPAGPPPVEASRAGLWPLALALVVGVAIGFGSGYWTGSRDGGTPTAPAAVLSAPAAAPSPAPAAVASSGREWTEGAIADAPKVAPPPAERRAAAAPVRAASEPPADAGRLLVRSTPAGARVVIDDRDRGLTPLTVRDLDRGSHRLLVERDGYAPEERRIVITSARPAQSVTIELERPPAAQRSAQPTPTTPSTIGDVVGALIVDSRPTGAKVFVDGKLVGTTPLMVSRVEAGEHAVRIELDGYRRWSSSVRVAAGERSRVTASLEQ